jgi:hypothetical protein
MKWQKTMIFSPLAGVGGAHGFGEGVVDFEDDALGVVVPGLSLCLFSSIWPPKTQWRPYFNPKAFSTAV